MSENNSKDDFERIDPPNKVTAALIAWLLPGFGHIYQGRTAKGILYACCIIPVLIAGIWMGSYHDTKGKLQIGRVIYYSWKDEEKRLYFIPQAMIGLVAIPAVIQSKVVESGNEGVCYNLFAPPRVKSEQSNQPTRDEIIERTHSWFDLGSIFTAIAGLLNLMVIFDVVCGPVRMEKPEKTEKSKENEKE